MKKLILVILTLLAINICWPQQTEKLNHCNCNDSYTKNNNELNGKYERKCNGRIIESGEFVNGIKNNEWKTYSRKGKLIRKLSYKNGKLNGKVELYYLNGKPKVTGEFKQGKKEGKWVYYTKKGKILCEGLYSDNKPIDVWTLNNKKGKKTVIQYDYTSKKYLINKSVPFHKDGAIIQNENTEEWYILKLPEKKYFSKSEPLGGYYFANYMFIELIEIPENFWDTYVYNIYKINYKLNQDNELLFDVQFFDDELPDDNLELTILAITNPTSKIKKIKHSELQLKLLKYKIKETLNFMPPWVYNNESDIEVFLHYAINQNLHKK